MAGNALRCIQSIMVEISGGFKMSVLPADKGRQVEIAVLRRITFGNDMQGDGLINKPSHLNFSF